MMFLLYISFLFLIAVEITYEVVNGDLHDFKSIVRTLTLFGIAEIFGIIAGIYTGFIIYGLIRVAIFDLIFAKLFKGDWFYLGKTSEWDKFMSKIPLSIVIGARILCLILSIYMLWIK